MHEMRDNVREKHPGEETGDVVIPVHCGCSFRLGPLGSYRAPDWRAWSQATHPSWPVIFSTSDRNVFGTEFPAIPLKQEAIPYAVEFTDKGRLAEFVHKSRTLFPDTAMELVSIIFSHEETTHLPDEAYCVADCYR